MHDSLRPWRPSRQNPFDADAASHLWRRAAFAASPKTVQATLKLGPQAAVARMVDGPGHDDAGDELDGILESALGTGNADSARAWLVTRMLRCDHQLREKLALFWHSHFATSIKKVIKLDWMMRQYRLFLDHGLTTFPLLLDQVTRDPAMIRWLDNETNSKGQANENFARELFELFTLGVGNYSERDVQEAGRAFTGWHILRDRFHLSKTLHDHGTKKVLQQTGKWGGKDVCRIALEQPACGRFLATKLLKFFVHPEPDEAIANSLGDEMRRSGYDMKATLNLLLGSEYFFSENARRSIVKSPMDFVVGSMRTLNARVKSDTFLPMLRGLGQDLLAPPNVKGWPGQLAWINTATWITRVNGARSIADGTRSTGTLDELSTALLGRPLPAPERSRLARSGAQGSDLVHALLSLPEAHLA